MMSKLHDKKKLLCMHRLKRTVNFCCIDDCSTTTLSAIISSFVSSIMFYHSAEIVAIYLYIKHGNFIKIHSEVSKEVVPPISTRGHREHSCCIVISERYQKFKFSIKSGKAWADNGSSCVGISPFSFIGQYFVKYKRRSFTYGSGYGDNGIKSNGICKYKNMTIYVHAFK